MSEDVSSVRWGSMVQSAEWREALTRYRWLDRYLAGPPSSASSTRGGARAGDPAADSDRSRTILATRRPYPCCVLAGLLVTGSLPRSGRDDHREPQTMAPFSPRREPTRLAKPRGDGLRGSVESSIALLAAGIVLNVFLAESAGFVIASAVLFWCTARAFDARHPVRDAVFAMACRWRLSAVRLASSSSRLPSRCWTWI